MCLSHATDYFGHQKKKIISFLRQSDSFIIIFYRGARTTITDGGGLTALERRMDLGAITDDELFILFVNDSCNTYRN